MEENRNNIEGSGNKEMVQKLMNQHLFTSVADTIHVCVKALNKAVKNEPSSFQKITALNETIKNLNELLHTPYRSIQEQPSEEKREWLKSIGAMNICDHPYVIYRGNECIMRYSVKYINETPLEELESKYKSHLEHLGLTGH